MCRKRLGQVAPGSSRKISYVQSDITAKTSDTTAESGGKEDLIGTVVEISQVKEGGEKSPPILVRVCVDGVELDMEVDTGASVSLTGEANYSKFFPGHSLNKSDLNPLPSIRNSQNKQNPCTKV